MAATVATSPARPPAPEASLALKHSTQAGGGLSCSSWAGSTSGSAGWDVGLMGVVAVAAKELPQSVESAAKRVLPRPWAQAFALSIALSGPG